MEIFVLYVGWVVGSHVLALLALAILGAILPK